jgi:hypothetical protein
LTKALIIVPCGRSKIWDADPAHGPALAQDAYTGSPFKMNRQYADRFGDAWAVLSAKYGFILPTFEIPEAYEVTFKRRLTQPVSIDTLREQIEAQRLHDYSMIVGLGGKEYRAAVTASFEPWPVRLVFPFAGLPLGLSLQATRRELDSGTPSFAELARA